MKHEPVNYLGVDVNDPEQMDVRLGDIVDFINAERAAAGLPRCKSIVIAGSDIPYSEYEDLTDVEFN